MTAVRIRRKLDSETLHLPELKPMIGKMVEIIVQEQPAVQPGTGDWDAAERAVLEMDHFDYDALRAQDECDRQQELTTSPGTLPRSNRPAG